MKLIISIEILIIFQKSLSQYIPHQFYNRYYTQAAYFEPFQNQEYSRTEREYIQTRKAHRKRKKYYDYYISAEIDEKPRKLKCKCTCKNYEAKPFQEYEQSDPCCQSYCENNRDNPYGIYTPIQYPHQNPNTVNTEMFIPVQYPSFSMIYPTIDLSEIGKAFPWLTWGVTKPTKIDTNDTGKDTTTTMKDDKGRTSTRDDKDKTSTIDDRDKTTDSTASDKHESSTKDNEDKTSMINERDKTMTSNDGDSSYTSGDTYTSITTTVSDRDFSDKTSRRDIVDGPNAKNDRDRTSATEKLTTESITTTTTSTTTAGTIQEESTTESISYEAGEKFAKLFHRCSKKKKCLQKNNYCSNKNNKIGRYFEEDLVERPTIASYLNGGRRNKIERRFYKEKPHYGNNV